MKPGWAFLLGIAVCFGCQKQGGKAGSTRVSADSIDVICTAWPLMELARVIAGNDLGVQLVEPESGLSWRNRRSFFPDDHQLAILAEAGLVIENGPGVPYANWIEMSAVAEDRVCNSSMNFGLDDYIPIRDYQSVHSHGPGGEHSHDYMVPYCWHDPALAAKQVVAMQRSLSGSWPELDSAIQLRADSLLAQLGQLGTEIRLIGTFVPDNTEVVLATPDLMFLARAMGLKPRYELWFDEVDEETWVKRIQSIQPAPDRVSEVVLLWPGTAPDIVRKTAGESITLIEIDMLESGAIEGTFLQRFARLIDVFRKRFMYNRVAI